ncbi:MAG: c-type cytochrome [Chitinophagaceae bacterium]|nr:c-type cytochrome [Chitinophagaceae bacterium]
MQTKLNIFLGLLLVLFCAWTINISEQQKFPTPTGWPKPSYNFANNPYDSNAVELGRALFYDPALSVNGEVSCAHCHSPYSSFTHTDHPLSHGIFDRSGKRNAPVLINLAWQRQFMWDGAIHHLDFQALAPLTDTVEMGSQLDTVLNYITRSAPYPELFRRAFGTEEVSTERFLKAIAQFMLSLISANSKYDKVMQGLQEFSPQEKAGYQLFQKQCNSCHREPLFTSGELAKNELPVNPKSPDPGLARISQVKSDSFYFKIPTLRNIEYSYPYMHDGRFEALKTVVRFYATGRRCLPYGGDTVIFTQFSPRQEAELMAFLLTLSDSSFIFNTKHQYPHHLLTTNQKQ